MGLSHNQIVTIGEQVEGVLQEVLRTAVEHGLHAEKGNCKGILSRLGRVGDSGLIINELDNLLNFGVAGVLLIVSDIGEQYVLHNVRSVQFLKDFVFGDPVFECYHLKV